MRIVAIFGIAVLTSLAGPAPALDSKLSPSEAFRSGYLAYKAGDARTALDALNYAAEAGHPAALWKLGRMYAAGDLVSEDDKKAMELFAKVANAYADGNPHGPDAPFVANSFVRLGGYYQSGIPGQMKADPGRARRYFAYAASYFGDPDAQFSLATMILAGQGGEQNDRQAARWFKLAARKGHVGAQYQFGHMLLEGIGVERSPIEGLMWLSVAHLSKPDDEEIRERQEQAFAAAEPEQRRQAMSLADQWLNRTTAAIATQPPVSTAQ